MINIRTFLRCLFIGHDFVHIQGDRINYADGDGYAVTPVTYHACKRCGKRATTKDKK
jgi:hypothetical protein